MFLSIGMLKQKYFLTDIFILSAEKQPIKLSWRKIEWLQHLFFDFKFKAKYLAFISCLLEKPDLSVKTALKSIFRKSQVRSISEKFGLNLNAQIVCLSPSQWVNCFLEMLEVVPEKFHPS